VFTVSELAESRLQMIHALGPDFPVGSHHLEEHIALDISARPARCSIKFDVAAGKPTEDRIRFTTLSPPPRESIYP
jgi:hypothetical protein